MRAVCIIAVILLPLIAGCNSSRESGALPLPEGEGPALPETTRAMEQRILAAHNAWRKKVDVPALTWSSDLAAYAQDWANTMKDRGCEMEHRTSGNFGENLAWAGGRRLAPETVVDLWGGEEVHYNYANNRCARGEVCGHYTQLVWANTKQVGCAVAQCSDSETWVCNYDPAGNVVGQKPY